MHAYWVNYGDLTHRRLNHNVWPIVGPKQQVFSGN